MIDVTLEKRREAIPLVEEIIAEHASASRAGTNRASRFRS
jgi:hypothetical protein